MTVPKGSRLRQERMPGTGGRKETVCGDGRLQSDWKINSLQENSAGLHLAQILAMLDE